MNAKVRKTKTVFTIMALLSVAMLILFPYEYASAKLEVKVDIIKTISLDDNGSYQHFVKICADKNNRLERPNAIISSDIEEYREQLNVNLPPGSCTHQNFIISADDPDSITVKIINSRNF